jgi:hypothetical protein
VSWTNQIFAYCERGADPSFWAEPINAVSNLAFLIAAMLAARELAVANRRDPAVAEWMLVALVAAIGVGSFLFHTFATIGLFMLGYVGYAARRYLGLSWPVVAMILAAFLVSMSVAGRLPCAPGLLPITEAAGRPCYNGSRGYIPAFLALLMFAAALYARGHRAWRGLLIASGVLAVSLTMRMLDFEVCAATELLGRARGTHAVWHVLNAILLYVLLVAAIRHGVPGSMRPVQV